MFNLILKKLNYKYKRDFTKILKPPKKNRVILLILSDLSLFSLSIAFAFLILSNDINFDTNFKCKFDYCIALIQIFIFYFTGVYRSLTLLRTVERYIN